jgi:REP element-mobilizing transposase RayT
MTNHIHLIIQAKKGDLSDVVRDLKKFTASQIISSVLSDSESRREHLIEGFRRNGTKNSRNKVFQFWTHENHAVELDYDQIFQSKLEYIHNNPVKAGFVDDQTHWLYSSARNYMGFKSLIEIDLP